MTPAPFWPRQPPERGTRVGVAADPSRAGRGGVHRPPRPQLCPAPNAPRRLRPTQERLWSGCSRGETTLDGAGGSLGQDQPPAVDLQLVGQLRLTLQRSALMGDVVDWPGQADLDRPCRWGKHHRLSSVDRRAGLGNPAVRGSNMMTSVIVGCGPFWAAGLLLIEQYSNRARNSGLTPRSRSSL